MDTSDDPVTAGMLIFGGLSAYQSSQNKPGSPPVANPPAIATGGPGDVEVAKKKEKRKQQIMSSVMTKEWDEPLSQPGLLGVN